MTSPYNIDTVILAAQTHGENSDQPDHEVGDLQGALRLAWSLFTPEQKTAFLADEDMVERLELGGVDTTPTTLGPAR